MTEAETYAQLATDLAELQQLANTVCSGTFSVSEVLLVGLIALIVGGVIGNLLATLAGGD